MPYRTSWLPGRSAGASGLEDTPWAGGATVHWRQQQQGMLRFNCADSLDRTNAASYFVAVQVSLGPQGSGKFDGGSLCHGPISAESNTCDASTYDLQALVEQCRQLDIVVEGGKSTAQQPHLQHKAKLGSSPTQEPLVLPKVHGTLLAV